jgi:hypothetical protein
MGVNKVVQEPLVFGAERVDKEQKHSASDDLGLYGAQVVLVVIDHVVRVEAQLVSLSGEK